MVSDSIANASIPPLFSKDFGKKKRTNRTAKLKQCKLDARREQWLSQVKNKGFKEEDSNGLGRGGGSPPSSLHVTVNLETRSRGEENEGSSLHDSDLESLISSPSSSTFGGSDSRKDRPGSSSGSSSSRSCSGCCSGTVSEDEEEDDDGCLDDWEAVADALTADEKRRHPNSEPPVEPETPIETAIPSELPLKPECEDNGPRAAAKGSAWKPDDAFRPQSLPNLAKQHSFPMHANRHCVTWACHSIISQPSSCPICYEDLDITDSSFLPCLCGFRLCLFCHKRILEADGRCPGCRKHYDPINGEKGINEGALPLRLSRSCSMSTRS